MASTTVGAWVPALSQPETRSLLEDEPRDRQRSPAERVEGHAVSACRRGQQIEARRCTRVRRLSQPQALDLHVAEQEALASHVLGRSGIDE